MRWYPYAEFRIPVPGHRTLIEYPATIRFGEPIRRYGYVWAVDGKYYASYEILLPGQVEDVDLGAFATASEARKQVVAALSTPCVDIVNVHHSDGATQRSSGNLDTPRALPFSAPASPDPRC